MTLVHSEYFDQIQYTGAPNQVVLIAQEEKFTLFIKGDSQGRYFDYSKQRMDGSLRLTAAGIPPRAVANLRIPGSGYWHKRSVVLQ